MLKIKQKKGWYVKLESYTQKCELGPYKTKIVAEENMRTNMINRKWLNGMIIQMWVLEDDGE
jgi:hypothetical protein